MKKILVLTLIFCGLVVSADVAPSLYEVKTGWLDTQGKKTGVGVAEGDYVLMTMVYTSCMHACPLTISKLQSLEKDIIKAGLPKVKLVLASFDVKVDRPEKLKKYVENRKLDPKQWNFLAASSEADARHLAVVLGISYKAVADGDFAHSNIIVLLDKKGSPLASIDSLSASNETILAALKKAEVK